MEFGNTIPLFYLTLCGIIVTPLIGLTLLAAIRFGWKDIQLSKNIIYSVIGCGILALLSPIFFIVRTLLLLQLDCQCGPSFQALRSAIGEIGLSNVLLNARWMIVGIDLGFVIGFLIVVPVTLLVRRFGSKASSVL